MAKRPDITTVASGFASRETLNDNFTNVRDQFDNTLSLDGSTPNAMGADLDMNSNDVLNAGIVAGSVINAGSLMVNGVAVTTSVSTIPTASSRGEEVYLLDRMTEAQAAAALDHTLTDDMAPLINFIIGEAGVTRLVLNGLIPISSPIDITVAKVGTKGFFIHTNTEGRAREVGGLGNCIIQKKSNWVGGYAIDVNSAGTEAIKSIHLSGFLIDGNGESGGCVRVRYAQDFYWRASCFNDLGYGMLLDGVWNADFNHLFIKQCSSGGLILDPVTRENSNLNFSDQPWIAKCGGLGELVLVDNASHTNGTIRFFNLLVEGPLADGATNNISMITLENFKRVQLVSPRITSESGRDAHCLTIGKASRVGQMEDLSLICPEFNNTSSATYDNCIRLINAAANSIRCLFPSKNSSCTTFMRSDSTTSDNAMWLMSDRSVIVAATDVNDLNSADHVNVWDNSFDIGSRGSAASNGRLVLTVDGKRLEIGGRTAAGVEKTIELEPEDTDGPFMAMNDYRLVLGSGAPSSASDVARSREIKVDDNYIYIATGEDTWKRVAIATW